MGVPFIFFILPLLTALQPLMEMALALTLVLTGFACAYIAMVLARHPVERGVALMTGAGLAFFESWLGLLIGVVASLVLIGGRDAVEMEHWVAKQEHQYYKSRSGEAPDQVSKEK